MVLTNKDYTIGWITALPVELAAARAMMDKPFHRAVQQDVEDNNAYTLGVISGHNVVLTCLPRMGTNAAAHAATNMLRSFPNLRCGVMVGIGGGVPGFKQDIRLGDIVVSNPEGQHGGVIQYDFGTSTQMATEFVRKGHLNKPPTILLSTLQTLRSDTLANALDFEKHYNEMINKDPVMAKLCSRPAKDNLFNSDYVHAGGKSDCSQCSNDELMARDQRTISHVHYGLIGSGNRVLRNANERDKLHDQEGVICFEMEASGLMDDFPCLIIRGICDYCDSHKSKEWQPYASAMAAAYAKELLSRIAPAARGADSAHYEMLTQCRTALKCTHPRYDKRRLEDTKGGLLRDAYKWILTTQEYMTWLADGGLLWIKGDPGKGKTMLICGIIDELDEAAYFFCQATLDTNRDATSVITGLILAILERTPSLSHEIHDRLYQAKDLPRETTFYMLAEVLEELVAARKTTIMIDALDECLVGRDVLLRFIAKTALRYPSRWMVSSRNYPEISEQFGEAVRVSLELNETSVSAAVAKYIDYKVQYLSERKSYDKNLAAFVKQYLLEHANGTFLWVSLVCLNLAKVRLRNVRKQLEQFPSGLESLYGRMMDIIHASDDQALLKQILATMCTVYRPLSIEELVAYTDLDIDEDAILLAEELVCDCGSFLTTRNRIVQFIHQSAKDFLVIKEPNHVLQAGGMHLHYELFRRSLKNLDHLMRNPYGLTKPGTDIRDITAPDPDPLFRLRYASIYWLEHLLPILKPDSFIQLEIVDVESIIYFMQSKFLFWLEALCLLRSFYPAFRAMAKLDVRLRGMIEDHASGLGPGRSLSVRVKDLIHDGVEFMRYFQDAIDRFPLQIYISGMMFTPKHSFIREHYVGEASALATVDHGLHETWPEALTLYIHFPTELRWSKNDDFIGAIGNGIHIWDSRTGVLVSRLPRAICWEFIDDKTIILAHTLCRSVEIWSITQGIRLEQRFLDWSLIAMDSLITLSTLPMDYLSNWKSQVLIEALNSNIEIDARCGLTEELEDFFVSQVNAFGHDPQSVVVAHFSQDCSTIARGYDFLQIVLISCTRSGVCKQTLKMHQHHTDLQHLRFSSDSSLLAASSRDDVWIWDLVSGSVVWHTTCGPCARMEFFSGTEFLAIAACAIHVWQWRKNKKTYQIYDPDPTKESTFARDIALRPGRSTMFTSNGTILQERNIDTSAPIYNHGPFLDHITSFCVSTDGARVAIQQREGLKVYEPTHNTVLRGIDLDVNLPAWTQKLHMRNGLIYVASSEALSVLHFHRGSSELTEKNRINPSNESKYWEFSPDLTKVAVVKHWSKRSDLQVWDLTGCRMLCNDVLPSFNGICWGPADNQLTFLNESPESFTCWDYLAGRTVKEWLGPGYKLGWRFGLTWSPHGKYLLVPGNVSHASKKFDSWDAINEQWNQIIDSDHGIVDQMAFSSCGDFLAYIMESSTLRVIRLDNHEVILTVNDHGRSFLLALDDCFLKNDKGWYNLISRDLVQDSPRHLNIEQHPKLNWISYPSWIRYGTENLIWLPTPYRPKSSPYGIDGSNIVLKPESERIVILNVDLIYM